MLQYLTGKYYLEEHQTKKITDKDIFYSNTLLIELVKNKEKLETPIGTLEIINLNDLYINLEYCSHFGLKVCLNLKK